MVCSDYNHVIRPVFCFLSFYDPWFRNSVKISACVHLQVIGLNSVPIAGDEFEVVDVLDVARERAEARAEALRNERISAKAGDGKVTLSSLASAVSAGKLSGLDLHTLNIILKVDLQVSITIVLIYF